MAGFSFSVLGSQAVLDRLSAFEVALQADIQKTLEEAGEMGKERAEELAPVGSREYTHDGEEHPGWLKSQMYVEVEPGKVTIGNKASYAEYVEEGTSKMRAQPYLGPASLEAGQWLRDELRGIANTSIGRV